MAANTFTAFPEFTAVPFGNRRMTAGLLTGPTSYTRVTVASPPTGGQAVSASQFGLTYIDAIFATASDTGAYTADWTAKSITPQGVTAGTLIWRTATTPIDEVGGGTNLSAKYLRVVVIGR